MSQNKRGLFRRGVEGFNRILAILAAMATVAIMVIIVASVLIRTFTGMSMQGASEIATLLFVIAAFLGMGYAQLIGSHIVTSLVTSRLRRRVAEIVQAIGIMYVGIVVAFAVWANLERTILSYESAEVRYGLFHIPMWPARLAIVIGFLGLGLQLFIAVYDHIRAVVAPLQTETSSSDVSEAQSLIDDV